MTPFSFPIFFVSPIPNFDAEFPSGSVFWEQSPPMSSANPSRIACCYHWTGKRTEDLWQPPTALAYTASAKPETNGVNADSKSEAKGQTKTQSTKTNQRPKTQFPDPIMNPNTQINFFNNEFVERQVS